MLLELHNLTVGFDGFVAVDHVNFSVENGEKRVIIGPNGAGMEVILQVKNLMKFLIDTILEENFRGPMCLMI